MHIPTLIVVANVRYLWIVIDRKFIISTHKCIYVLVSLLLVIPWTFSVYLWFKISELRKNRFKINKIVYKRYLDFETILKGKNVKFFKTIFVQENNVISLVQGAYIYWNYTTCKMNANYACIFQIKYAKLKGKNELWMQASLSH